MPYTRRDADRERKPPEQSLFSLLSMVQVDHLRSALLRTVVGDFDNNNYSIVIYFWADSVKKATVSHGESPLCIESAHDVP